MLKIFISLILTIGFTLTAQAQMYYDTERTGEGIVILHQDGRVQFTMFSYTDTDDCTTTEIPTIGGPSLVTTCVGGPQAWYVSESAELRDGVAHGIVYQTEGCRYPDICGDNPDHLANVFEVASWELLRIEGGWSVEFLPFRVADPLPLDASFYAGPYTFNTRLFGDVP